LIFFNRDARVLDSMLGQITQKLAKRLGAVEGMARNKTLHF
jgi:hypothetical protein